MESKDLKPGYFLCKKKQTVTAEMFEILSIDNEKIILNRWTLPFEGRKLRIINQEVLRKNWDNSYNYNWSRIPKITKSIVIENLFDDRFFTYEADFGYEDLFDDNE